jgi:pseudouridine kinase
LDAQDSSKERILDLIQANPFIPQQELAERLGITRSSVASHIAQLIRDHRLLGRAYVLPKVEPIMVAGGANLDRIAKCLGPVAMGTSNPVVMQESFGGVARNVSENLSRLGFPVRLLTAVGDDEQGARLLRQVRDLGVDTGICLTARGASTGTYTAMLKPDGEMVLAMSDMAVMEQLTLEVVAAQRNLWAASRMRVMDLNLPMVVLAELMEDSAHSGAMLVAVAVSEPKMDHLPASLKGLSVLILNTGELGARMGARLPNLPAIREACLAVLDQGLESIVVTMGKQGVLCCGPDRKPRHFPAPPARIVDVTGAGDAFSSGVVAGLAREPQDLARACQIGQRLAAVTLESLSSVAPSLKPVFLQECEKAFPPTHPKAGSHE